MIKIKVTYKTGAVIEEAVNYLHIEAGKVFYTVDKQAHPIFEAPVGIPIENIETLDLQEIKAQE